MERLGLDSLMERFLFKLYPLEDDESNKGACVVVRIGSSGPLGHRKPTFLNGFKLSMYLIDVQSLPYSFEKITVAYFGCVDILGV